MSDTQLRCRNCGATFAYFRCPRSRFQLIRALDSWHNKSDFSHLTQAVSRQYGGVIVQLTYTNDPRLLAHEFAHVEQYERFGIEAFLREYIQQLARYGHQSAPFEIEAEAKAVKACRDAGLRI